LLAQFLCDVAKRLFILKNATGCCNWGVAFFLQQCKVQRGCCKMEFYFQKCNRVFLVNGLVWEGKNHGIGK